MENQQTFVLVKACWRHVSVTIFRLQDVLKDEKLLRFIHYDKHREPCCGSLDFGYVLHHSNTKKLLIFFRKVTDGLDLNFCFELSKECIICLQDHYYHFFHSNYKKTFLSHNNFSFSKMFFKKDRKLYVLKERNCYAEDILKKNKCLLASNFA